MKKFILVLPLVTLLFSCNSDSRNAGRSTLYSEPRETEIDMDDQPVYICTGKYAKAYHYDTDCEGLGNCKGEIISVTIDEAEEMGRHPCHYCQ